MCSPRPKTHVLKSQKCNHECSHLLAWSGERVTTSAGLGASWVAYQRGVRKGFRTSLTALPNLNSSRVLASMRLAPFLDPVADVEARSIT